MVSKDLSQEKDDDLSIDLPPNEIKCSKGDISGGFFNCLHNAKG
jgi:hypothetical protein